MVGDLISQLKTKHNYQHHGTQAYKLSYLGGVACDYHRGEDVLVKESRFHGTENFHPFSSRFRRVISRPGVEIRKNVRSWPLR